MRVVNCNRRFTVCPPVYNREHKQKTSNLFDDVLHCCQLLLCGDLNGEPRVHTSTRIDSFHLITPNRLHDLGLQLQRSGAQNIMRSHLQLCKDHNVLGSNSHFSLPCLPHSDFSSFLSNTSARIALFGSSCLLSLKHLTAKIWLRHGWANKSSFCPFLSAFLTTTTKETFHSLPSSTKSSNFARVRFACNRIPFPCP